MAYVEKNDLLSKEKQICSGQITIIPKTEEWRGFWSLAITTIWGDQPAVWSAYFAKKYACLYIDTASIFTCISIYIVMTYFKSQVTSLLLQLNLFQVNNHLQKTKKWRCWEPAPGTVKAANRPLSDVLQRENRNPSPQKENEGQRCPYKTRGVRLCTQKNLQAVTNCEFFHKNSVGFWNTYGSSKGGSPRWSPTRGHP